MTVFRALQLALTASGDPALTILGAVALAPTWFVSTAFNLRLFAAQWERDQGGTRDGRLALSSLRKVLLTGRMESVDVERAQTPWGTGVEIELGRVEVELRKD
jgi:hypothetical protein